MKFFSSNQGQHNSEIFIVKHHTNNKNYIKNSILYKCILNRYIHIKIQLLKKLSHPYIVKYIDFFYTHKKAGDLLLAVFI